ncbi:hypothetical protein M7775_08400 [Sporomusa sphaeroides DSM 2875]|uniref:hypothetical protein n=1 Tax=Sporomusa sphaeroides TaxID=47679 RepID=UPI00202F3340|nr:hypothetical protein [Sporomusa sphaeroides]MCM0758589.1 hypothetical protein [Sporomusa sphaeroides DSM 2875]
MFSVTKRQAAILLGVVLLVADNSYFVLVGGFSLSSNILLRQGVVTNRQFLSKSIAVIQFCN